MTSRMMRKCLLSIACAFALVTVFTLASGQCADYDFEIAIDVAPNVLNLQNQGQVVTVHTNISYGLVDAATVYLSGIPINSWKADNRGYFVAKFLIGDVKNLVAIGSNILTLTGITTDGSSFWGEQTITVVDNKGKY